MAGTLAAPLPLGVQGCSLPPQEPCPASPGGCSRRPQGPCPRRTQSPLGLSERAAPRAPSQVRSTRSPDPRGDLTRRSGSPLSRRGGSWGRSPHAPCPGRLRPPPGNPEANRRRRSRRSGPAHTPPAPPWLASVAGWSRPSLRRRAGSVRADQGVWGVCGCAAGVAAAGVRTDVARGATGLAQSPTNGEGGGLDSLDAVSLRERGL